MLASRAWPLTGHGVTCNRVLPNGVPMSWHHERYPRTRADWLGLDLPFI